MMNPELKAKWVKALRSGEYIQGKGYMNRNGKFCCLGVLAEVLELPKQVDDVRCDTYTYEPQASTWGFMTDAAEEYGLIDEQAHLQLMNDSSLNTFDEIADYIEKSL